MFLKNSEGRMPPGEKESDFCNNMGIIDLEQKFYNWNALYQWTDSHSNGL